MTRLSTLILLALACCDPKPTADIAYPQENSTPDNNFLKFVSLLPKLELPFEINCEKCCDHPEIDYDNELIAEFKPEGSAIVGLIDKTSDKVIILVTYMGDIRVPSVKVYDLEGKPTGQMNFMTRYCGGDFEYYGQQFFKITSDRAFISIDTSYHLKMDSVDYHVIDTTKIEITRREFVINDKGEFVEQ